MTTTAVAGGVRGTFDEQAVGASYRAATGYRARAVPAPANITSVPGNDTLCAQRPPRP